MQEDVEQDVIQVLRRLPIAITIIKKNEGAYEGYIWQCLEGAGTATCFACAMTQALHYLIGRIAYPALSEQFRRSEPYVHDCQIAKEKGGPV